MVYTVGVESLILEEERLKLSNKSICKYREKKQSVLKMSRRLRRRCHLFALVQWFFNTYTRIANKILCSINEERADELILCSGVDIEILKRFTLSYLFSFFLKVNLK